MLNKLPMDGLRFLGLGFFLDQVIGRSIFSKCSGNAEVVFFVKKFFVSIIVDS